MNRRKQRQRAERHAERERLATVARMEAQSTAAIDRYHERERLDILRLHANHAGDGTFGVVKSRSSKLRWTARQPEYVTLPGHDLGAHCVLLPSVTDGETCRLREAWMYDDGATCETFIVRTRMTTAKRTIVKVRATPKVTKRYAQLNGRWVAMNQDDYVRHMERLADQARAETLRIESQETYRRINQ